MQKKPRLVLADDHAVLRSGLKMLLESQGGFEVVGEAYDGQSAVRLTRELAPDAVLMDISMPHMDGVEATRRIKEACPGVRILVLTMHDDVAYLREVLTAGASGYVLKKAVDSELISAIHTVLSGEMFVYPTLTRALVDDYLGRSTEEPSVSKVHDLLSARELEVLRLVAFGHTSREIGTMLSLSAKTVEGYRARVMDKLQATSRTDLIRQALEAGLLDPAE